jgi:serine/threonine protein kinase
MTDDPLPLPLGAIFASDFRLLQPLGQGGMGAVYVAEQRSTGQLRAIKILRHEFQADLAMRARFEQEARIGARILSAHVAQIIAAGVDSTTGYPWICMELLNGATLEQRYPLGVPVPPGELRVMMEQLGHGLGAAHREGIVHRDLKPENIFLARSPVAGLPFLLKLLDFGIARALSDSRPGTTALGSPYWMAPEQIQGNRAATPATDVWALGLLAYRLATGQLYWKALRRGDESPMLVFQELADPARVAPSQRLREQQAPAALPEGFDRWFLRCLALEPSARWADGAEATRAFLELQPATLLTLPSVPTLPAPPGPAMAPPQSTLPPSSPSRPRALVLRHRSCATAREVLREYGSDLTLEGLWIRTSKPLPAGTMVSLEIRGASELLMASGGGTIGEVNEQGMMLRFSALSGPLVDEMARQSRPR